MSVTTGHQGIPARMRRSVVIVLMLTVLLSSIATFFGAQRYFERAETQTASNRMALYLRALNETLRQHQHLPFILANDPRYMAALNNRDEAARANDRLRTVAGQAKLEAIYLMDADGMVIATSNAGEEHSFLGQNYGFRPYFKSALGGERSDYFAIGATSGRPGYFVAEPVAAKADPPQGVIAIKLDVSELQHSWESESDTVVAIDENNIVVLASNPDWLYRPISALSTATRQSILAGRQFGSETLTPLPWTFQDTRRAVIENTSYLMAEGESDWRGWRVFYLRPQSTILRQTLLATALFGSLIALLVGFATYLRSRRIEQAYAASERQRVELIRSNTQLEHAQTELARSAKLAALGHLSASVTHELVQPIGAFRNHLAAAEINNEITSPETAANLHKLVNRMEAITRQFRYFVRGRSEEKSPVRLSKILDETTKLLADDIAAGDIRFACSAVAPEVWLNAHQIQMEQVFTNLLKNAIQAVENETEPCIYMQVTPTGENVIIRIKDNGPGIADATLSDLEEPFFSTKPSGVGMGLGLAIATKIIKEHGGQIALGRAHAGAEFIITLPLYHNGAPS